LVMQIGESRCVMLTLTGERLWTRLHPTSKYRIS
jgi:hypothetical protein